jgi:hypothetical protein
MTEAQQVAMVRTILSFIGQHMYSPTAAAVQAQLQAMNAESFLSTGSQLVDDAGWNSSLPPAAPPVAVVPAAVPAAASAAPPAVAPGMTGGWGTVSQG